MLVPFFALLGGVTMVKFMLLNGDNSMVSIIGISLAAATGPYWGLFASYLGAIGAFFSGSATISNLIFGGVQQSIATQTGLNMTSILAMQSVGGAMGNMTCINNIIAASSVSGVYRKEGYIWHDTPHSGQISVTFSQHHWQIRRLREQFLPVWYHQWFGEPVDNG